MSQQRNGLYGLAQTHLVRQDTVESLVVHGDQPVQADVLILAQLVAEKERYWCLHLKEDRSLLISSLRDLVR